MHKTAAVAGPSAVVPDAAFALPGNGPMQSVPLSGRLFADTDATSTSASSPAFQCLTAQFCRRLKDKPIRLSGDSPEPGRRAVPARTRLRRQ